MEKTKDASAPLALVLWLSAGVLAASSLAGCGKEARSSLSGKVTLAGKPVTEGAIVLRPLQGTRSPGAITKINGGQYSIGPDVGLVAGKYLVAITATRGDQQYIPDKYNRGSELTVELTAGENTTDFSLEEGFVSPPLPVPPGG